MAKGRLVMLKRRVTRMTTESKTLEERYEKIEGERSHLLETFQGTVEQVQRKSELKNVRLGERLERVDAEYGTRAQQVRKEKGEGEGRRGRRGRERKERWLLFWCWCCLLCCLLCCVLCFSCLSC